MKIKFKFINDLSLLPDGVRFVPQFPAVEGLSVDFIEEAVGSPPFFVKGSHSKNAVFYGSCAEVKTLPEGVEEISESVYKEAYRRSRYNVPHREGWVFDENNMVWVPPVPYPEDGLTYEWNEENLTWVKSEHL